jgi:hypothetical protein
MMVLTKLLSKQFSELALTVGHGNNLYNDIGKRYHRPNILGMQESGLLR